jgi:hypothetical protein
MSLPKRQITLEITSMRTVLVIISAENVSVGNNDFEAGFPDVSESAIYDVISVSDDALNIGEHLS